MTTRRILKATHAFGTAWFIFAAGYIFIMTLRQAGLNWWMIFSLSGNTAAMGFLLLSAYLFTIFRADSRQNDFDIEHPLTNSRQYMIIYSVMPILGTLAGLMSMYDAHHIDQVIMAAVLGTLAATFGFWIVIDPAITMIEMSMPVSRAHRARRIFRASEKNKKEQLFNEQIFEKIEQQETFAKQQWSTIFADDAQTLRSLALRAAAGAKGVETKAIELGLCAWQRGGLECMQHLIEMTCGQAKDEQTARVVREYISAWWDGIGSWRYSPAYQ